MKSEILKLKNLTTQKIKTHLCDNPSQLNNLKHYFTQNSNYEVLQ